MKRAKRRGTLKYSTRDMKDALAFVKTFSFVDGDNYLHFLDEDPAAIGEVAALIAKVRRRGERVIKQLRDERAHNNESNCE